MRCESATWTRKVLHSNITKYIFARLYHPESKFKPESHFPLIKYHRTNLDNYPRGLPPPPSTLLILDNISNHTVYSKISLGC